MQVDVTSQYARQRPYAVLDPKLVLE
jgi:hypothetical protein